MTNTSTENDLLIGIGTSCDGEHGEAKRNIFTSECERPKIPTAIMMSDDMTPYEYSQTSGTMEGSGKTPYESPITKRIMSKALSNIVMFKYCYANALEPNFNRSREELDLYQNRNHEFIGENKGCP